MLKGKEKMMIFSVIDYFLDPQSENYVLHCICFQSLRAIGCFNCGNAVPKIVDTKVITDSTFNRDSTFNFKKAHLIDCTVRLIESRQKILKQYI